MIQILTSKLVYNMRARDGFAALSTETIHPLCAQLSSPEEEGANKIASSLLDESNALTYNRQALLTIWANHYFYENANESCYSHCNLHGTIDGCIGVGHNQF